MPYREGGTRIHDRPSHEFLRKDIVRAPLSLQSIRRDEHRDAAGVGTNKHALPRPRRRLALQFLVQGVVIKFR